MTKRSARRALWLAMCGLLLAACTGRPTSGAVTPGAGTPGAPTLAAETPTAAPSPTPPATARQTAEAYLSAWQQGDYAAMHALLALESQAALSAPDLEAQYSSNLALMSATTVTATVTAETVSGAAAQVTARAQYPTALVGVLEADLTLPLALAGGRWGVVYSPALIWPDLVDGQKLYMFPFTSDRGNLYDRNGLPLARTEDVVAVGVVPGEVLPEHVDAVIDAMARLLGVSSDEFSLRFQSAVVDQYLPVTEALAGVIDRRYGFLRDLPGVYLQPYTSRFYHGTGDAATVTGYVSPIQPDELNTYLALGYSTEQRVGRAGLEAWAEAALAGRNGGQLMVLDGQGQVVKRLTGASSPSPAQDVYSTIDFELQQQVQFAVKDFSGAAVVLDKQTGAVLAMASNPAYDPNLFDVANNRNAVALPQLFADARTPLLNRATQGVYPLGSVFKVVTMAAGLTSGAFQPEDEYTCTGFWNELNLPTPLEDWTVDAEVKPHGDINLKEGLSASCNPWFYHIGYALYNLNPAWLSDTARAFGLGQATGIAQVPEDPGQIPDPEWMQRTQGRAWGPLDSTNLAIGQGDVLVTPLQVARMMAAIGNGGTLLRPQLVLRIQPAPEEAAEGVTPAPVAPTYEFAPETVGTLPLSAEQLAAMQEGMENVVKEPRGTARTRFRGFRIPVAGKTGTAEDGGVFGTQEPDAWFAGYTYAGRQDRPDIAVAVVVQNQGQGSEFAAPIFRRILEAYFGLPLTRYPWESSVGVVATPEPTAAPEAETPTPQP